MHRQAGISAKVLAVGTKLPWIFSPLWSQMRMRAKISQKKKGPKRCAQLSVRLSAAEAIVSASACFKPLQHSLVKLPA